MLLVCFSEHEKCDTLNFLLRKDVCHMAHNGTRYPEELKRQIIDLCLSGKSVTELANEYGLVEQTIYRWKKLYAPTIKVDENQTISMKEYNDLQKKMRELEMENEILKKATAIFAKKQ